MPGRTRYTERQLYYELCRVLRPVPGLTAPSAVLVFLAGAIPLLTSNRSARRATHIALAHGGTVAGLWVMRNLPYTLVPPLSYQAFCEIRAAYCARVGELPGMLPPAQPVQIARFPGEYDLHNYGLPRLLVCQHDDIAQMLLANGFHMEMKCSVLGLSSALPLPVIVRNMLVRASDAHIFFLHDASANGFALAVSLREQLDVPQSVRVVPIGLRPLHARRLHLFVTHVPGADTIDIDDRRLANLPPGERAWVQRGLCAEVAAIPPATLLLKLRRIVSENVGPTRRLFPIRRDREVGFMTWPVG